MRRTIIALALATLAACDKKSADAPAVESVASAPSPAPAAAPFDLAAIPVAASPLPAFPFVEWPTAVAADARHIESSAAMDAVTLIAGEGLRTVEGRTERRVFSIPAGSSPVEMRRFYRERITALGGVSVNRLQPVSDAATVVEAVRALVPPDVDPAKRLGLARYDEGQYQYETYVVRTDTVNAWFVVQTSTYSVHVTTVAEAVTKP